ncbi:hypothetical protein [Streptomyces sp. XH2]|uniref:hypothetical protein n=1 Tax=Streptomyces sp. XH2 TaxID=3412483 RepID=UPI003C79F29D
MTHTQPLRLTPDSEITEIVAFIAATVSKSLARNGKPGHDLDTVMHRMTTDAVLSRIRLAYLARINDGQDPRTAVTKTGQDLIREYVRHFNF